VNLDRKGKIVWSSPPNLQPALGRKTVETGVDLNRVKTLTCVPFKRRIPTFIPRIGVSWSSYSYQWWQCTLPLWFTIGVDFLHLIDDKTVRMLDFASIAYALPFSLDVKKKQSWPESDTAWPSWDNEHVQTIHLCYLNI